MTLKSDKEYSLREFVRDFARLALLGISGWTAIQFIDIRDNSKLQQERYTIIKAQQDQYNLKLNELIYNNQQLQNDVDDAREIIELIALSVDIKIPQRKTYRQRK